MSTTETEKINAMRMSCKTAIFDISTVKIWMSFSMHAGEGGGGKEADLKASLLTSLTNSKSPSSLGVLSSLFFLPSTESSVDTNTTRMHRVNFMTF